MGFFTTTRRRVVKPWLKPYERPSKGVVIKYDPSNSPVLPTTTEQPRSTEAVAPAGPNQAFIAKYRKA